MKYLFCGFIAILVLSMASCNNAEPRHARAIPMADTSAPMVSKEYSRSVYKGMRDMAINTSSGSLGLDLPPEKITVYGVVMDWGLAGKVVTTVAYQTGDASLYTSTGSGMSGKDHENIRQTAKEYVKMAQDYLGKAKPAGEITVPGTDTIQFCFLTNKGIYMAREDIKNYESAKSPWFGLISEANNLIEQLRKSAEEKKPNNN